MDGGTTWISTEVTEHYRLESIYPQTTTFVLRAHFYGNHFFIPFETNQHRTNVNTNSLLKNRKCYCMYLTSNY